MPRVHQCPSCSYVSAVDDPPAPASPPGAGTVFMVAIIFVATLASTAMIFYMWRYFAAIGGLLG